MSEDKNKPQGLQAELQHLRQELNHERELARRYRQELEAMQNTLSWRVTAPLRGVMRRIIWARQLKQAVARRVREHGGGAQGVARLTSKAWRVARHVGVRGLARQIGHETRSQGGRSDGVERPRLLPPSRYPHPNWVMTRPELLVSVVVCVHNALDDVRRCLQSVLQHTRAPYELVLVDDGSREDTAGFLAEFAADNQVPLIRNDQARGYTLAANQGMRAARGDVVILLNSDTIVTPRWIELLLNPFQDEQVGIVGPASNTASWQSIPLVEVDGDWAENPLPDGWSVDDYATVLAQARPPVYPDMPFLNGFCFAIHRRVIEDIGYFDEENFAAGYGEENDYGLRARQAGWRLVFSDNAYVYHAQSKSYSHEKRLILGRRAGETLARKFGQQIITDGVLECRNNPVLLGLRAHAAIMVNKARHAAQEQRLHQGRRVLFVLPVTEIGGGANIVLSEASAMRRMGVDAQICNLASHQSYFERAYPTLDVPVLYIQHPGELPEIAGSFDAVVATVYHTVQWLKPLESGPQVLGYYIQDYEPLFFDAGTAAWQEARQSYSLLTQGRLFTKTTWNRDLVQEREGVQATAIGVSYEDRVFRRFRPATQPVERVRILAMVRLGCDRRGPLETLDTLQRVVQMYGDGVEAHVFGSPVEELEQTLGPNRVQFHLHGMLTSAAVAELMNTVDVFVDFSSHQAMGLTALEAMACGLAVVVPEQGGAVSFVDHDRTGLVVDTTDASQRLEAVCQLVDNPQATRQMGLAAMSTALACGVELCASNILDVLFAEPATPVQTA